MLSLPSLQCVSGPKHDAHFAVAAEICWIVFGGGAAAEMVFFCPFSVHLWRSAHHCNMAVGPALVALGHIALTMK
jgi:hypothetical protein